jgi:DnaJ-class molecular chaperone
MSINCPECAGLGEVEYDRPVRDFVNGGEYESYWADCENCHGSGQIEPLEGDEE